MGCLYSCCMKNDLIDEVNDPPQYDLSYWNEWGEDFAPHDILMIGTLCLVFPFLMANTGTLTLDYILILLIAIAAAAFVLAFRLKPEWKYDMSDRAQYYINVTLDLYCYVYFYLQYELLGIFHVEIHNPTQTYYDLYVQEWEETIFGSQVSQTYHLYVNNKILGEYLHFAYFMYFFIIMGAMVFLYLYSSRRDFLMGVCGMEMTWLACFATSSILPVEGPYYYYGSFDPGDVGYFFSYVVDYLLSSGGMKGTAFPSEHCAVAVAVWVVAWLFCREYALYLFFIVPALVNATVWCGYHYGIDAIFGVLYGIIFTPLGVWFAAQWIDRAKTPVSYPVPWNLRDPLDVNYAHYAMNMKHDDRKGGRAHPAHIRMSGKYSAPGTNENNVNGSGSASEEGKYDESHSPGKLKGGRLRGGNDNGNKNTNIVDRHNDHNNDHADSNNRGFVDHNIYGTDNDDHSFDFGAEVGEGGYWGREWDEHNVGYQGCCLKRDRCLNHCCHSCLNEALCCNNCTRGCVTNREWLLILLITFPLVFFFLLSMSLELSDLSITDIDLVGASLWWSCETEHSLVFAFPYSGWTAFTFILSAVFIILLPVEARKLNAFHAYPISNQMMLGFTMLLAGFFAIAAMASNYYIALYANYFFALFLSALCIVFTSESIGLVNHMRIWKRKPATARILRMASSPNIGGWRPDHMSYVLFAMVIAVAFECFIIAWDNDTVMHFSVTLFFAGALLGELVFYFNYRKPASASAIPAHAAARKRDMLAGNKRAQREQAVRNRNRRKKAGGYPSKDGAYDKYGGTREKLDEEESFNSLSQSNRYNNHGDDDSGDQDRNLHDVYAHDNGSNDDGEDGHVYRHNHREPAASPEDSGLQKALVVDASDKWFYGIVGFGSLALIAIVLEWAHVCTQYLPMIALWHLTFPPTIFCMYRFRRSVSLTIVYEASDVIDCEGRDQPSASLLDDRV